MMRTIAVAWALFAVTLTGCATTTSTTRPDEPLPCAEIDPTDAVCVAVHTTVPPGLASTRDAVAADVVRAHAVVTAFAAQHGWQTAAAQQTFDSVHICDTAGGLWRRVLDIHQLAEQPTPPGVVAALEGGVLLAVTPDVYAAQQPEYARLEDSWMRLLAHEMVHRLHVEVLGGDEEAMGPRWFFEGFAVVGAGQGIETGVSFASTADALAAARDGASPLAYRRWAAVVRYFMARAPLAELVSRAGDPDFEQWLGTL